VEQFVERDLAVLNYGQVALRVQTNTDWKVDVFI
jgi:hypothetical protein